MFASRFGCLVAFVFMAVGCDRIDSSQPPSHAKEISDARPETNDEELLIFAAASLEDALEEIRRQFISRYGGTVRASYASSAGLAQQIQSGARAHLFLSASVPWADKLGTDSAIVERRDLLGNRLVVVVPKTSPHDLRELDDLTRDEVKRIALGDPSSVPAGVYAKQALERAGLWNEVRAKVVASSDVRQALSYVELGAVDAAIVYSTDAAISKNVHTAAMIPTDWTDPIRYPVLLLQDNARARQFFEHLATPESIQVFRQFGFEVFDGETEQSPML